MKQDRFVKAAVEVLEAEGGELHFTDITTRAIDNHGLSEVWANKAKAPKTPESTMNSKLSKWCKPVELKDKTIAPAKFYKSETRGKYGLVKQGEAPTAPKTDPKDTEGTDAVAKETPPVETPVDTTAVSKSVTDAIPYVVERVKEGTIRDPQFITDSGVLIMSAVSVESGTEFREDVTKVGGLPSDAITTVLNQGNAKIQQDLDGASTQTNLDSNDSKESTDSTEESKSEESTSPDSKESTDSSESNDSKPADSGETSTSTENTSA